MTERTTLPTQIDGAFFERLFHGAGLAVFVCDIDGNVQSWNPLGMRLFRSQVDDQQNDRLRDAIPESDRRLFDSSLGEMLRTGEPVEFRTCIHGPANQDHEFAVWFTPVFDDGGEIESVAVWFNDITARIQLRRSMRKRERLTALGALSGSVAHHYNNLLCSIATSMEFALNMNTMSAMRRVLRRSAEAVSRATHLTQQLLAFAQADHRTSDLVDLTEAVLRYFDGRESALEANGIEMQLNWERIPMLPLPRDQITVVIDNLVNNAVEAMPDGGTLTASLTQRDESHVMFAISDTGCGIPMDKMEHVFEPFFTTKGELGEGKTHQPGMGLAVAHGLVNEMRGSISVTNRPTGGTRFEIVLPIPRQQPEATE